MRKEGQFNISFGMIFSIIVIIAILGVAFYVITNFISLSECTNIGLFYNDLKNHIDKAWRATIHEEVFVGKLPSDIELVCFGNSTTSPDRKYRDEYNKLVGESRGRESNLFLYPPQNACDSNLYSLKLEHITVDSFFCISVKNGKVEIKTKKDRFDALVKIIS